MANKVRRLISIDFETDQKLTEEENASALINKLIENHFNKHLSDDLEFLKSEVMKIDNEMKNLQNSRDLMSERIKSIIEKTERNKEVMRKQEEAQNKTRVLEKWLAEQSKKKIINFEEYRQIKQLNNWEDIVQKLMDQEIKMEDVVNNLNL